MQASLPAGFAVGNPPITSPEWTRLFPGNQASDQHFRMIIRPNAPGQRVRVRLSNLRGSKPVAFDALGIATRRDGKALADDTGVPLTFGGAATVTIKPGADAFSDPIAFDVVPERGVEVSFHVVGASGPITWHAKAMTTSYLGAPGANGRLDDAGSSLTANCAPGSG